MLQKFPLFKYSCFETGQNYKHYTSVLLILRTLSSIKIRGKSFQTFIEIGYIPDILKKKKKQHQVFILFKYLDFFLSHTTGKLKPHVFSRIFHWVSEILTLIPVLMVNRSFITGDGTFLCLYYKCNFSLNAFKEVNIENTAY